jgi:adenine nucleotide transporter 17
MCRGYRLLTKITGISTKVTQSVLTAAFLFAFKDVLYDMTVKARRKVVKAA